MNKIEVFCYQGCPVAKNQDGFVNLTQMCQANNKRLDNFLRLKTAQAFISELERVSSQSLRSEGLVSNVGGKAPGTWGHPILAIELARWISPAFSIWCGAHIFKLMSTGATALDEDPMLDNDAESKLSRFETRLKDLHSEINQLRQELLGSPRQKVQKRIASYGAPVDHGPKQIGLAYQQKYFFKREICYRYSLFNGGGGPDYKLLNNILRTSGLLNDPRAWHSAPKNGSMRVFDANYLPQLEKAMHQYLPPSHWTELDCAA